MIQPQSWYRFVANDVPNKYKLQQDKLNVKKVTVEQVALFNFEFCKCLGSGQNTVNSYFGNMNNFKTAG